MAGTAPQNAMQSLAAGGLTGTGKKISPEQGTETLLKSTLRKLSIGKKISPEQGTETLITSTIYSRESIITNRKK